MQFSASAFIIMLHSSCRATTLHLTKESNDMVTTVQQKSINYWSTKFSYPPNTPAPEFAQHLTPIVSLLCNGAFLCVCARASTNHSTNFLTLDFILERRQTRWSQSEPYTTPGEIIASFVRDFAPSVLSLSYGKRPGGGWIEAVTHHIQHTRVHPGGGCVIWRTVAAAPPPRPTTTAVQFNRAKKTKKKSGSNRSLTAPHQRAGRQNDARERHLLTPTPIWAANNGYFMEKLGDNKICWKMFQLLWFHFHFQ